jgi:polysaccharide biosynthesis protein PslH
VSKPALVFLCHRIPFPPIKGERITSFNLLRHLVRGYRVFLGTFFDDPADLAGIETLRRMVEGLHVGEIRRPWAFLSALPRWLRGEPVSFALFRSRGLDRWLDEVEAIHKPVAVVTHSSNISAYAVDKFRRGGIQEPRRVLHFADVDSEKFLAYAERASGLARWIFTIEARRVRREERRMTALADTVCLVTDEEAELFRSILDAHQDRVTTLPNGVDTDVFDPKRYPDAPFQRKGPAFVFTGVMDYAPNIEAVTWFAHEVFPGIRAALPDAQFLIVGSKPTGSVQGLGHEPAVIVTGRVESTAAYLAHAQVAVAPLQIARGIQNKVLEAMAMAVPVVVSKGAMTGISATSGEQLICADAPRQWIDACVSLARNPGEAHRMGQAARKLMLDLYNWEAQFARLDRMLGPAAGKT